MAKTTDIPIVNIEIYRLDIYRLLTLLLADKIIVKDEVFQNLSNDNFDNEVNRLLVLVAVVTRQLLKKYIRHLESMHSKQIYQLIMLSLITLERKSVKFWL